MNELKSSAAVYAPAREFSAMEVFGKRSEMVAVRPSNSKYLRVWTVPVLPKTSEAELRAVDEDMLPLVRGTKGCRSWNVARQKNASGETLHVTITLWNTKKDFVNFMLDHNAHHHPAMSKIGGMLDYMRVVATDGCLLDI
jgi:heme-degrading monooxygenase HmoA